MKYNYSNIEDMEFETLSRDLLKKYTGFEFSIFAKGRDNGIDGRYENENEKIIFQSKHYLKTGFDGLFRSLEKNELKKVKELSPTRYILITTLDLTPNQVDKIFGLFKPYIKNKLDIIGQKKIDEILDSNKEILLKYPNLWFDYGLLKEIFGEKISSHYSEKIEELKEKYEVFVWCNQYNKIFEKLEKENMIIITGAPGVGKSTLASILCLKYLFKEYEVYDGSFEELGEIFEIIKKNISENKKTIIFLDDFLGHHILDYFNGNNSDNSLIKILKKIKRNPNIKLIATSRTSILNEANEKSEKFKEFNLNSEKRKKIIKIEDYSIREKALILYKHLKRSKLKKEFLKEIIDNKIYNEIIEHQNYSPRLIEYITNEEYEDNIGEKYSKYILDNLDKPVRLWEKPFENLCNDLKILFILVCSFRREISKEVLEDVYYGAIDDLEEKISSFKKNLEILEGSFLKIENKEGKIYIDLINPSLRDFFVVRLKEERNLYRRVLRYTKKIDQIYYLRDLRDNKDEFITIVLEEKILNKFSKKDQMDFYRNNLFIKYKEFNKILIEKNLFTFLNETSNYSINFLLDLIQAELLLQENKEKIKKMIINQIEEDLEEIEFVENAEKFSIVVNILIDEEKIEKYQIILQEKLRSLIEEEVDNIYYEAYYEDNYTDFLQNCIMSVADLFNENVYQYVLTKCKVENEIENTIGDIEDMHMKMYIRDRMREEKEEISGIKIPRKTEIDELFQKLKF